MKKRLIFILKMARDTPNQEVGEFGCWFFCPLSRFADSGKSVARTKKTWEKAIILFACMGLIERNIPTAESADTPYRKKAVECAAALGHDKAAAFISIPEYSERQLEYIEAKAKRWTESGANLQHFSKATVIEVFGSAIANKVFQDERRKPYRLLEGERELVQALSSLLDTNVFTTKEALFKEAEARYGRSRKAYKSIWERRSKWILKSANAVHKPPTKAEKTEHELKGGRWIIMMRNNVEKWLRDDVSEDENGIREYLPVNGHNTNF